MDTRDTPEQSYQTSDSNEQLSDKSEQENPFSDSGSEFNVSSNDSISDCRDNSYSLPNEKKRKRLTKNIVSQASTSRKGGVIQSSKVQKTSAQSAPSGFEVSKKLSGSGPGKYFIITCINKVNNDKEGVCKLCNQKIKMTKSNTSGLKRHLQSKHQKYYQLLYPPEKEKPKKFIGGKGRSSYESQTDIRTMLSPSTVTSNTSTVVEFNQIEFEELLIGLAIKKYLPFRFFEDETCTALFSFLNKEAKLPKRNALRAKIANKYSSMQEQLINYFKINNYFKISTTIDSWTSNANMSFYGITAHFIDQEWKLKSVVLDFNPALGQHAGVEIANIFNNVINKYAIKRRIQGITTDSAASNFTFAQHLSNMMDNFDSKDNHFVCFSHILNLAVQDLLKIIKADSSVGEIKDLEYFSTDDEDENYDKPTNTEIVDVNNKSSVDNIRILALKIKRSEQIKLKFISCCKSADLTMLMPVIDIRTRWNSTLNMVNWALRMKKPLNIFCENNDDLKDYLISSQDWELVSRIFNYLKVFKTISDSFQGEKYCTLPMVVLGINMLLDKLETWAFELDNCPNRNTTDEQVIEALQAARDKIVKHYSKTNWIYCVVLILDPRHKTETFNFTNWGRDLKQQAIFKFENLYNEVYYVPSNNDMPSTSHNVTDYDIDDNTEDEFNLQSLFEKSNGNKEQSWRKEIDEYCLSKRAEGNQDILEWWRKNEAIYPNLSKMARDFLSIQATSVPAERLFSRATLTIRKERSRLTGESAQFLMCLNSWLCNKDIFMSV